jgi:hypothetical protein
MKIFLRAMTENRGEERVKGRELWAKSCECNYQFPGQAPSTCYVFISLILYHCHLGAIPGKSYTGLLKWNQDLDRPPILQGDARSSFAEPLTFTSQTFFRWVCDTTELAWLWSHSTWTLILIGYVDTWTHLHLITILLIYNMEMLIPQLPDWCED